MLRAAPAEEEAAPTSAPAPDALSIASASTSGMPSRGTLPTDLTANVYANRLNPDSPYFTRSLPTISALGSNATQQALSGTVAVSTVQRSANPLATAASPNTVFAGPVNTPAANGTYRQLVPADLPVPAVSTLLVAVFSATPVFDASAANIFETTLTGNITSFTIVNPTKGQTIKFIWLQDATGGRTVSGAPGNLRGFTAPGTTASTYSIQTSTYDGTNWICETANTNI